MKKINTWKCLEYSLHRVSDIPTLAAIVIVVFDLFYQIKKYFLYCKDILLLLRLLVLLLTYKMKGRVGNELAL